MKWKVNSNDIGGLRRTGILVSIVIALFAWFFLWQDRSGSFFFSFLAFFLLLFVLFKPGLFSGPYSLWGRVADIPGRILMDFFLTLFFFCVVTPIGMVAGLLRIDFLGLKMPKNGSSYWEKGPDSYWIPKKKKRFALERYEKQY